MIFSIKTNATLEAKSIDDVFRKLGKYYGNLAKYGNDTETIFLNCEAEIVPVKEEDDASI
jgi:hypothetical protein